MNGTAIDLVVLVPDKNMEAAVNGLLSRTRSLRIREIRFSIYVHPERDPGCLREGHNFLRAAVNQASHALLMFDRHGSGAESLSAEELERQATNLLTLSGWGDRARVIVIDPELEMWIWTDSPHVPACLGSTQSFGDLRTWLCGQGLWQEEQSKPEDPKRATEVTLRHARKPRSSAVYQRLARNVSLRRCSDTSFHRFRDTLREWFPEQSTPG